MGELYLLFSKRQIIIVLHGKPAFWATTGLLCWLWRKDIQITHQGKEPTGYIEACITKEGIPLWEKDSGRLVMKAKMLELGKQDEQWFKAPSDHKVVDMNALMQSLKALQK